MIQHFSIEGSWFEFVVLLIFLDIWWDLLIFGSWGFSRPSTDITTTPLPIVRSRSHWKLSPHWFQASQINGRWTRLTCGCNRHQNQSTSIIQKRLHQNISTQENLHPQQFLDNSTCQPQLALLVLDRLAWICFLVSTNQLNIHPWRSWTARASEQSKDWRRTSMSWPARWQLASP